MDNSNVQEDLSNKNAYRVAASRLDIDRVHTGKIAYSRRVVVSYKRKYVHKLLVNRLLKPAQEKVWLSELTVPQ